MGESHPRVLVNAVALAFGGARTVGLNLLRTLPRVCPGHQYRALIPQGVGYEDVCSETGIEFRVYPRTATYRVWRIWFDQWGINREAHTWGADVLLTLGNLGPIRPAVPHVVLVHNPYLLYPMGPLKDILRFREQALLRLKRWLFRLSLPRAAALLVQTPVAAAHLRTAYGTPEDQIHVVSSAITLEHLEVAASPTPLGDRIRRIAAGRTVLLTLSRYYPHKNLECVVRTAARLRDRGVDGFVFFITIASDQHPGARALLRAIEHERLEGRVINLGPITLVDLPAVYQASDAIFFPTLLESLSGSYLEAMHYRLPILTTDIDFARYTCGDAAVYFDPADIDGIVDQLEELSGNPDLRVRLAAATHGQLARFRADWTCVAKKVGAVLEMVAR